MATLFKNMYMASIFVCPLKQIYIKTNTKIEEQNMKNDFDFVVLGLQSWNFQGNTRYKDEGT